MDTSLTTFDGYPRDDLDVAQSLCKIAPPQVFLLNDMQYALQEPE